MYQETGSGRETARRLGIHENTVYAVLKRHKGLCVRCGRAVLPGKKHCLACLKALRNRVKQRDKEQRRKGLCAQCEAPVAWPSRQYCARHRLGHLEAAERYYNKKKGRRDSPGLYGAPVTSMREKQIRYNYGEAGITTWRLHNGQCVLCGIAHAERAVHIHHIDGNDTNHAESNLTCLCIRCHRTIHALLLLPNIAQAFAWLKTTYPALPWPEIQAALMPS